MDRRTVLAAASSGVAAVVAGCGGVLSESDDGESTDRDRGRAESNDSGEDDETETPNDEDGTEEPDEPGTEAREGPDEEDDSGTPDGGEPETPTGPDFTDVTIKAPDAVSVDEEWSLRLSAHNAGDEAGTFTDTIRLDGPHDDWDGYGESVTIDDVDPGETGTVAVARLSLEHAGRYRIGCEDADASRTVDVGPAVNEVGSTGTLENDVRVTLTEVTYETAVYYEEEDATGGVGLRTVLADQIFVVFHLAVENAGTRTTRVGPGLFEMKEGTLLEDLDGTSLWDIEGIDGATVDRAGIDPGERIEGWLLAHCSRDEIRRGVELAYHRDDAEGPPELTWVDRPTDGELALPTYELRGTTFPDEAEVGSEPAYAATVENTGDRDGTFRGLVQTRALGRLEWTDWKPVSAALSPGESATTSVVDERETVGDREYRLRPFDETRTVSFVTAQRAVGEAFVVPNGLEIAVAEVRWVDTYETAGSGSTTSREDATFLLVGVECYRHDERTAASIGDREFAVQAAGVTIGNQRIGSKTDLVDPLSGPALRDLSLGVRERAVGYVAFEVPDAVDRSDVTVRWEKDGTAAEWTV